MTPNTQMPELETEKKVRRFIHRHSYTIGGKHNFDIFLPAGVMSPQTLTTHSSIKSKGERPLPPIPARSPLRPQSPKTVNPSSDTQASPTQAQAQAQEDLPSSRRISSLLIDIDLEISLIGYYPRFDLLIPTPLSERRKKMERVWKKLGPDVRARDVFRDFYDSEEERDADAVAVADADGSGDSSVSAAYDSISGNYAAARDDYFWDRCRSYTASPISSQSSSRRTSSSASASTCDSPLSPLTPTSPSQKLNISRLFIKKKTQCH